MLYQLVGGGGDPWFVALADFCGGSTPTLPFQATKVRSLKEQLGRDVRHQPRGAGSTAAPASRPPRWPQLCVAVRDGPR